jgi:hypothetical protein
VPDVCVLRGLRVRNRGRLIPIIGSPACRGTEGLGNFVGGIMKSYVTSRAPIVVVGLVLAMLPGLTPIATAASHASRYSGDLCTLAIRPVPPPDGPYYENFSVNSNGFTLGRAPP